MPRVTRQSLSSKRNKYSPVEGVSVRPKRRKFEEENHSEEVKENVLETLQQSTTVLNKRENIEFTPSPRKQEIPKSDESDDDKDEVDGISAYEKFRQENIRANEEFFATLGIFEAKESLNQATVKPKATPSQRGIKREKPPPPPRRSSMRLRKLDPEGIPVPILPEPLVIEDEHDRPPSGPLVMNDYLYGETEPSNLDRMREKITHRSDTNESPKNSAPNSLDSYIKVMSKTNLTAERVAKVVPNRIFSVGMHAMCDKVLVAAGGKWGRIGVWDVEDVNDDQHGVVTFAPHSRPVNNLIFSTWHQDRLYSCSYDGSLRCTHFEKGVMEEVYSVPEDVNLMLRNFDFVSVDTLLVGQHDGTVVQVDQRTSGTEAENIFNLHLKPLRTVNIHPVNKNYFITSSSGEVSLWDIRKVKSGLKKTNSSIVDLQHEKLVSSAYFSPVTGNYILTTSADNKLRVFDSSSLDSNVSLTKAIRHNNFTGRWLTSFRAVWHPAREDVFVVGSMEHPRRIELFDINGKIVHTFSHPEYLGSVCSLNAFHPTRPIVAGGNASGRVHVFM